MTIIRKLEMTPSKFFKFQMIFTYPLFLPSFSIIWLESEKITKKICLLDHVFNKALPHLFGYHGNNKWPIFL